MISRVALRAVGKHAPLSTRGLSAAVATRVGPDTVTANDPVKHIPTSPADYVRFKPSEYFGDSTDKNVRAELQRIKVLEEEAIAAVTQEVPDIDWDYWRSQIRYPGLVDELKAAHDALPVPDVEKERERLMKAVEDVFNPLLAKIKQLALEAEESGKDLEKRLDEVNYLRDGMMDITIDEFLEKYPAVKKSIAKDVEMNRWLV
jgi:ATP synthase D chain, mitochondrial (ATP5H)